LKSMRLLILTGTTLVACEHPGQQLGPDRLLTSFLSPTAVVTRVVDLGPSSARGINIHGQIAGITTFASFPHAALWTVTSAGVTLQDLGTLPGGQVSEALAISKRGQIAGLDRKSTRLNSSH